MEINEDGKVWVLVECISQFRIRYMVETSLHHPEYALDAITMQEAKEFSQEHLGESIVSHRIISERDALLLCREDNKYLSEWDDERLKHIFFTKEGEKATY